VGAEGEGASYHLRLVLRVGVVAIEDHDRIEEPICAEILRCVVNLSELTALAVKVVHIRHTLQAHMPPLLEPEGEGGGGWR
jgi:hypothetical protein